MEDHERIVILEIERRALTAEVQELEDSLKDTEIRAHDAELRADQIRRECNARLDALKQAVRDAARRLRHPDAEQMILHALHGH